MNLLRSSYGVRCPDATASLPMNGSPMRRVCRSGLTRRRTGSHCEKSRELPHWVHIRDVLSGQIPSQPVQMRQVGDAGKPLAFTAMSAILLSAHVIVAILAV